jgi:circadian clock protein KaiB
MAPMSALPTTWRFRLYVADDVESLEAEETVRRVCRKHLASNYVVEVVRVHGRGETGGGEDVLFVPSCVRLSPAPLKTVIDLSSFEQLLV